MAAPPSRRASPPVLPDELVEEILLRLPPEDPACLVRASLVCKTWGCAVSRPIFRRLLHEHHGTAPVLGFLHNWPSERIPNFMPTTASPFSLAAPDRRVWQAVDCRHGRALYLSEYEDQGTQELLVWEPTTGRQRRVFLPAAFNCRYPNAAVFCAADACDHRDCHGGPFCVVLVFRKSSGSDEYDSDDEEHLTSACVYSSETDTWGEPTSTHVQFAMDFGYYSSVLVGRSLLYFMSDFWLIVEYDWARHSVRVFEVPDEAGDGERCTLMLADDGGLGVTELTEDLNPHLKLWSRVASDVTDARWVLSRVINLEKLLPIGALVRNVGLLVVGFAEGANVIFVNTVAGLFAIELQSGRVNMVCHDQGPCRLIPVVTFYTPVPRNRHQDLRLSNAAKVLGGQEERGEQDTTVDRAQQLFDDGSNAIKEGTTSRPSNVSAMS
ncbi:uncharacterized protein LOC124680334 [Lolium rigidum]|uniref:uncharacterized protein LOC124680334 n=1 Tax=Lolium rigidum TaxID=89674 RepID=UPI001F5DD273|nr:uncharacterized protein LOC124680334 [Lolium rigidum]